MARPTWEERDLPILAAIVEVLDEGADYVEPAAIVEATGLDERTVQLGLFALYDADPAYIDVVDGSSMGGREIVAVNSVTGAARRAVGTWPTPEGRAAEIIAAIEKVAERAPDEETRSRLRTVAGYLGNAGRDLLVQVAATAIAKSAGIG